MRSCRPREERSPSLLTMRINKDVAMKKFLSKLYILSFMAMTVFFMVVIWNVTFGHLIEEYEQRKSPGQPETEAVGPEMTKEEQTFKKIILEGDEKVKHYLGYRVLEEMKIEGHFHHIDYEMSPDNRSACVECHGDIPHDQKKEIRAFGNMHSAFIACETCHVRLEGDQKTGVFKWYDRKTGKIIDSPITEGVEMGRYNAKIVPFERVDGELRRIDTQSSLDFAREYQKNEKTLSERQKSKAKKIIHKMVSEKPYMCEDCHRKDGSLLPFEALGYSKKRADILVSTEVVGMIKDYTKFHVPRMLHPGLTDSEADSTKKQ